MADRVNYGGRGNTFLTAAWITITTIILLAPLVAMQFTNEVNWTLNDFAFAAAVLVGSGIIYELAARAGNWTYQLGVVAALGAGVLTMWVTGAVGIIGSEANPGNLVYVGVVALAVIGAIIVRGRAAHMAWVMVIVALAELLAPVIAFAGVANPQSDVLSPEVFVATAFFTVAWLLSAWLFRKSTLP